MKVKLKNGKVGTLVKNVHIVFEDTKLNDNYSYTVPAEDVVEEYKEIKAVQLNVELDRSKTLKEQFEEQTQNTITMKDLELGNIMFNTNTNQRYECPKYVVALLDEISRRLKVYMLNMGAKYYDSPFENSGNRFKNNVFEVQAYSWDEEVEQEYNFKYYDKKFGSTILISWYKYLGRDTTINGKYNSEQIIRMFQECLESLDEGDK